MTSDRTEHPLPQNPGTPGVQPRDAPDEIRPDLPDDERPEDRERPGENDEDGAGADAAGDPDRTDRGGEPKGLPREPEPGRS